jgi:GNAT superfamily N-acetyltransferase
MSFPVVTLTAESYPRLVREACASLRMPYRVREDERSRPPGAHLRHLGAIAGDGLLVGYASVLGGPGTWVPDRFKVVMLVDEAWRRRGAGGSLYREAERFALEHGATAVEADVGEENAAGLAFAERRGFVRERHLFASILDLASFDASRFAGVVAAAEDAGICFTSLAAYPQDDTSLARFADLLWEVHKDVPGGAALPRLTLEQVRSSYVDQPAWDPARVLLAADTRCDDEWVALAHLAVDGSRSPEAQRAGGLWLYNAFTGVRRSYRGRGLAQAIKVEAAAYARSRSATAIRTHNDSTNAPMLAVNRKLGYRPQPGYFKMVRTLAS